MDPVTNPKALLTALCAILKQENVKNRKKRNLNFINELETIIKETDYFEVFRLILNSSIDQITNTERKNKILEILINKPSVLYNILARNIDAVTDILDLYNLNIEIDINTIELIFRSIINAINSSYYICKDYKFAKISKYYILNISDMKLIMKERYIEDAKELKKYTVDGKVLNIDSLLSELFSLLKYCAEKQINLNFQLTINTKHTRIVIALLIFHKFNSLIQNMKYFLHKIIPEDEIDKINELLQEIKDVNKLTEELKL